MSILTLSENDDDEYRCKDSYTIWLTSTLNILSENAHRILDAATFLAYTIL
jgi:hypothetical protein